MPKHHSDKRGEAVADLLGTIAAMVAAITEIAPKAMSIAILTRARELAPTETLPSHALPIALKDVLINFSQGRCPACGWHLEAGQDNGCAPFNCSMRPKDGSPEHERWLRRAEGMQEVLEWATALASAPSTTPRSETPRMDAAFKSIGADNPQARCWSEEYAKLECDFNDAMSGAAKLYEKLKRAQSVASATERKPAPKEDWSDYPRNAREAGFKTTDGGKQTDG